MSDGKSMGITFIINFKLMVRSSGYFGSKFGSGVYQKIINLMPIHDIYIEGFLGSGAILKIKKPAKINYGFEINSDIIPKFFPMAAGIHKNDVKGSDVIVFNLDFIKWLQVSSPFFQMSAALGLKVLLYLDPPYLIKTRKNPIKVYKNELSESDHVALLSELLKLDCYVMISCYDNEIYRLMLQSFHNISYNVKLRSGSCIEYLYYNFSDNIPKNEYTFLGNNFRERAKNKSRIQRTVAKFLKMNPGERDFIFSEVASKIKMPF